MFTGVFARGERDINIIQGEKIHHRGTEVTEKNRLGGF
jgi:hypothetical protein